MRVFAVLLPLLAAAPARAEAPFVIEHNALTYDVLENGGYTATSSIVFLINNQTAASGIGQLPIPYSPSWQPIEAVEAYLEKPDGTRIPVDPAQMRDQPTPGDASLQMFTDMRQRVVVYPTVSVGDRLAMIVHTSMPRPRVPGGFTISNAVLRTLPWADTSITVNFPPGQVPATDIDGFEHSTETRDGRFILHLHAAYPAGLINDIATRGPFSRWPHYHVSTFADWNAFAASYAPVLLPHAAVTPKIQALADELTQGLTDRRAQATALYDWVRGHIRYVAVFLGNGGIDPHDADAIAASGFGDCKDHVVMLHALLAAKGIPAEMVLINLGNESEIAAVPAFAPFNHIITYIPEFNLYADSTNTVAPFGDLLFSESGKPVIHIGGPAPALRRTPVVPSTSQATADTILTDDGALTGLFKTTATGPLGLALRLNAYGYAGRTREASAAARLKALGLGGTGSFSFDPPEIASPSYQISGTFNPDKEPSLLDGQSFTLWTGARPLDRPGDVLLGPVFQKSLPDNQATFCFPGRQSETLSVTIPEGREIEKLPRELSIDNDVLSFSSHWTLEGRTVTVRREAVSKVAGPVCDGETRKTIATAMQRIRDDYNRRVEIK